MALLQRINSSLGRNGPERETPLSSDVRSAGDDLRRRREAFGLALEDVETALKIRRRFLAAIEDGRTDLLPGAAYAIGFVRAYSAYLGLDSGEILRRFKLEASGFGAKPDLLFPVPLGEQSMPGRGVVIAGLVSAICAYAVWYYWSAAEQVVPERVTEVPATLSPGEFGGTPRSPAGVAPSSSPAALTNSDGLPGTSTAAPSTDQSQAALENPPSASLVPAPSPAPQQSKVVAAAAAPRSVTTGSESSPGAAPTDAVVPAAPQSPPAAVAPAPAPPAATGDTPAPAPPSPPNPALTAGDVASNPQVGTPKATATVSAGPLQALAAPAEANQPARVLVAADSPSRIVLRATADSWIQIRDTDRTVLFTGVLKAGDVYRVPDRPGLVMRAGHSGGLDILVDGKLAPPLGRMGAVRNVTLDPQSLTAENSAHD
jgi:cytoskeleton protein RodZ